MKRIKLEELKQDQSDENDQAAANMDSDSDIQEMVSYAELRRRNVEDNARFLAQIGVAQIKSELHTAARKAKTPSNATRRMSDKKPKEVLPRRHSLRLQRITPDGIQLPPSPPKPVVDEEQNAPRKPPEPLPMIDRVTESIVDDKMLRALFAAPKTAGITKKSQSLASFVASANAMKLTENTVVKMVPSRVFSIAVSPADDVVVAAGDKWGRLGLWNVDSGSDVVCFEPHTRPVCCLSFMSSSSGKLVSSSYDGTLRRTDVEQRVFEQVYSTPEEDDVRLSYFAFQSPDVLLVAQGDGRVAVVDTRTNPSNVKVCYTVHTRNVKCVSVHPVHTQYFVTAGADGMVRVWDVRSMHAKKSDCLEELPHNRSVDSAYFSPITGNAIVTTAMDDTIRVYNSEDLDNIKHQVTIKHNNHTGRWLSNFRATWHPSRDDVFVVGSLDRPRQIELFGADGTVLARCRDADYLGSVCSLNAFHPTRMVLAGANSSGRVHVFK